MWTMMGSPIGCLNRDRYSPHKHTAVIINVLNYNAHCVTFQSRINRNESRLFWMGLILCPLIWAGFFIICLFGLKFKWMVMCFIHYSQQRPHRTSNIDNSYPHIIHYRLFFFCKKIILLINKYKFKLVNEI